MSNLLIWICSVSVCGPYSQHRIPNAHSVRYRWMDFRGFFSWFLFFFKNPVDCLVWESSRTPKVPRMLWGRPKKNDTWVKISACVDMHVQSVNTQICSTRLRRKNVLEMEKKKKKILFAFIFVHFCPPPPVYFQVQIFKEMKDSSGTFEDSFQSASNTLMKPKQPFADVCRVLALNVCLFSWSHTGFS